MANFFQENILDEILSRVDIVEVISSYIPLKRAGRNFKACCPFHKEKTASFIVSPDKQIYHCFGCGVGGNAFNFLMEYDRMDFSEAVRVLAKKAGVILPEKQAVNRSSENLVAQLYQVNDAACKFYCDCLNKQASQARSYFAKRGIKQETAGLFKLGFAPDNWDSLLNFLRQKDFTVSLIEKAGLVIPKGKKDGYYDRFRNRIIFSVCDVKSRIIGFGARVLDDSLPKYINSPETPIYIKGKVLYGLDQAKDAIREEDLAIIVEGYFDCIIPYQHGIHNIVASSGTALTVEQIRLLKRYTHNVCLIYDPDTAGQMATLRSLDLFVDEEMQVKIVSLPAGFDPDLFVRKHGVDSFKNLVKTAENLFDYKMRVLKKRFNVNKIEDKAKICQEMLPTINRFNNEILRSEYIKKLAFELLVKEEALLNEINKLKKKNIADNIEPAAKANTLKPLNINPTEKLLIKLMLDEARLIDDIKQKINPGDFQDERTVKIVELMFNMFSQGQKLDPCMVINHLGDEQILKLVCESTFMPPVAEEDKVKVVDDCIQRLKTAKDKQRRQVLQEQIKIAQAMGDEIKLHSLIEEFHLLVKKG